MKRVGESGAPRAWVDACPASMGRGFGVARRSRLSLRRPKTGPRTCSSHLPPLGRSDPDQNRWDATDHPMTSAVVSRDWQAARCHMPSTSCASSSLAGPPRLSVPERQRTVFVSASDSPRTGSLGGNQEARRAGLSCPGTSAALAAVRCLPSSSPPPVIPRSCMRPAKWPDPKPIK
jgi:hypothetical protein